MLYTLAVADEGDTHVQPIGPTAEQPELLPRREAESMHDLVLVVPWEDRSITVEEARNRLAEKATEDAALREAEAAGELD